MRAQRSNATMQSMTRTTLEQDLLEVFGFVVFVGLVLDPFGGHSTVHVGRARRAEAGALAERQESESLDEKIQDGRTTQNKY
jgi:hypothetical protein